MNFQSSKVVKTSNINTRAMKPKAKLKAMVRTTPISRSVGKLKIEGRNLRRFFDGARCCMDAATGDLVDLRRRNEKLKWRSPDNRITNPTDRFAAGATHPPIIGERGPAGAR